MPACQSERSIPRNRFRKPRYMERMPAQVRTGDGEPPRKYHGSGRKPPEIIDRSRETGLQRRLIDHVDAYGESRRSKRVFQWKIQTNCLFERRTNIERTPKGRPHTPKRDT